MGRLTCQFSIDLYTDLDLNKFKTKEGDIKEIDSIDLEKEYLLAKKRLTLELNKITKPMKDSLNKKLSKEIKRIKDHYSKQIQEKDYEVKNYLIYISF